MSRTGIKARCVRLMCFYRLERNDALADACLMEWTRLVKHDAFDEAEAEARVADLSMGIIPEDIIEATETKEGGEDA